MAQMLVLRVLLASAFTCLVSSWNMGPLSKGVFIHSHHQADTGPQHQTFCLLSLQSVFSDPRKTRAVLVELTVTSQGLEEGLVYSRCLINTPNEGINHAPPLNLVQDSFISSIPRHLS